MNVHVTKTVPVEFKMVVDAYQKVRQGGKATGIDGESWEDFDKKLEDNLYVIWNRLSSGSYHPSAVREVEIPKKDGKTRKLGIPTLRDRIAQQVVKKYMEQRIDQHFHRQSYGYRPLKSSKEAIEQVRKNCKEKDWVIDLDISKFFDEIDHELLMKAVEKLIEDSWVTMYVERWLKSGVEQQDGSIVARQKGTPQGGVISPLLANIYLHHAFDKWMDKVHPQCPFERYADDIVVHCSSKAEAEQVLERLKVRMEEYELTLHPDKTRIVYCRKEQGKSNEDNDNESFTFLSYNFQPRTKPDIFGRKKTYTEFSGAISNEAKTTIKEEIRGILWPRWSVKTLEWFAEKLNPKIRGWINYYTRYNRREALNVFNYLNELIRKWTKNKYKLRSCESVYVKYKMIQAENTELFYHWKLGIK